MEQCGLVAIFHHTESFVLFAYTLAAWKVNDGLLGNDQSSFCEFLFLQLCYWSFIIVICLLTESMLIFFLIPRNVTGNFFRHAASLYPFQGVPTIFLLLRERCSYMALKLGIPY